ncbi:hypothetical protein V6N11_083030 [Hibiscus sabdariffa]|uniref:Uncharacterized protein n=1 Tax=Hibiscus sabdariffa TaxID=183260 RepID=A0ABR2QKP9_9ROSI
MGEEKEPEGVGEKRNVAGGLGLKTRRRNKSGMDSTNMENSTDKGDGGGGGGGKFNHERRRELKDSGGVKSQTQILMRDARAATSQHICSRNFLKKMLLLFVYLLPPQELKLHRRGRGRRKRRRRAAGRPFAAAFALYRVMVFDVGA